ncbi:MAG: hypothetical protein V3W34_15475 [Phycisphaerae bacterium]
MATSDCYYLQVCRIFFDGWPDNTDRGTSLIAAAFAVFPVAVPKGPFSVGPGRGLQPRSPGLFQIRQLLPGGREYRFRVGALDELQTKTNAELIHFAVKNNIVAL